MTDPCHPANVTGGAFILEAPTWVFSPEQFDADANLMVQAAHQFTRREVAPVLEQLDAFKEGLMESLFRKACDLGLGGIEAPVRFGGLGLKKSLGTRIVEAYSLNGSFATTLGVHCGIAQSPITLFGTDEQCERYLPRLTSGAWMGAYALSEAGSGSDALSLSCRADRTADGSFRLSGTKMWVSNARWAGLFIVFARTDKGVTAFLVEREYQGVSVGPEEHKMGLKGSSTARLVLDDVEVPASNVLYFDGEGHRVALNALNLGRFKLAAMALGPARDALHHSAKYALERKQFGSPIARFGLVREKVARCTALFFAAESMLYRTAGIVDHAFSKVDDGAEERVEQSRIAAEECAVEASIGKVFATEMLAACADEAVQIHGGYGFTEEFPVARIYRDARVTRIYEGTNEINRIFVINRLVRRGHLAKALDCEPTCDVHCHFISAAKAAWEKYGGIPPLPLGDGRGDGGPSQQLAARLADLAMHLYAVQAVRMRAQQMAEHPQSEFARACAATYEGIARAAAATAAADVFARCGSEERACIEVSYPETAEVVADAVLEAQGYPIL